MGHVAGERQEPTHCEAAMAMVMNAFVVSDGAAGAAPAGRDHEEIGLGLVAAASDRGLRHERNEDAVALATVDTADGPVVISVVCDGVSSADRPDEASLAAANAAVQVLAAAVQDGVDPAEGAEQAVAAARAAVDELADGSTDTPAATHVSAGMAGG